MIFLKIVAFMRDGSDVAGLWEAAAVLASGRIGEWFQLSIFNLCFDLLCSASKLPLVSFGDGGVEVQSDNAIDCDGTRCSKKG